MIPDYDFTLLIPPSALNAVLDEIGQLCDDESRTELKSARDGGGEIDVGVAFRSLSDMPQEIAGEFPSLPDGSHAMGNIYLSAGGSGWSEFGDTVKIRLWPCTRRLQRACFGSAILRGHLIRLLERHGCYVGYVVYESCDFVPFWEAAVGQSNEHHPAEYVQT